MPSAVRFLWPVVCRVGKPCRGRGSAPSRWRTAPPRHSAWFSTAWGRAGRPLGPGTGREAVRSRRGPGLVRGHGIRLRERPGVAARPGGSTRPMTGSLPGPAPRLRFLQPGGEADRGKVHDSCSGGKVTVHDSCGGGGGGSSPQWPHPAESETGRGPRDEGVHSMRPRAAAGLEALWNGRGGASRWGLRTRGAIRGRRWPVRRALLRHPWRRARRARQQP
jgi:hypothetical protein